MSREIKKNHETVQQNKSLRVTKKNLESLPQKPPRPKVVSNAAGLGVRADSKRYCGEAPVGIMTLGKF